MTISNVIFSATVRVSVSFEYDVCPKIDIAMRPPSQTMLNVSSLCLFWQLNYYFSKTAEQKVR